MNMTTNGGVMRAAADAKQFLREHGSSFSQLLRDVAGESGLYLAKELQKALDGDSVDPVGAGHALRAVSNLLIGSDIPRGVCPGAFRWHGARVTDLAARFPN